jgi:hypothetical protein
MAGVTRHFLLVFSNRLAEIISTFTSTTASVSAHTIAAEEKKKDNPHAAIIATSIIVVREQSTAITTAA